MRVSNEDCLPVVQDHGAIAPSDANTGAHRSKDHRGVDLISDALPIRAAMVWRAKRNQQHNRLRKVSQSIK
jgi:hypothetical protein